MGIHEETKLKAYQSGVRDYKLGLNPKSNSAAGSMWDKHYNRGYSSMAAPSTTKNTKK